MRTNGESRKGLGPAATAGVFAAEVIAELAVRAAAAVVACLFHGLWPAALDPYWARGETGQQLLLGAYQALARQIHAGKVNMHTRMEMLDLVVHEGRTRGIVTRDLASGKVQSWAAAAVVLATGGYSNVFFLSTNAKGCNVTAAYRAYKPGAGFANPCYTQIHPTGIPPSGPHVSKTTLMSESLRNDGRVWMPSKPGDRRPPGQIIEAGRYVSVGTGGTPDANEIPIATDVAERSMDAAACVGCGGCVAACPNASAMLFTAAKIAHLGQLPQGEVERAKRARAMVEQMDAEGFGNRTNHYECMEACRHDRSLAHFSIVWLVDPAVRAALDAMMPGRVEDVPLLDVDPEPPPRRGV